MIYTPMTKKALKLCFKAHRDQVDKSGMPYVFHPFHLAEQMTDEDTTVVALLHDVVEDTAYTLDNLLNMGFPPQVLEALKLMTRDKAMPYMKYIAAIKQNRIARVVKLADLNHNSDMARLDFVDDMARDRLDKYSLAIELLRGPSYDTHVKVNGLFRCCFARSEHQETIKLSHLSFRDGYYVTEYENILKVRAPEVYYLAPDAWCPNNRLKELWYDSMINFADIPPNIAAWFGLETYPVVPNPR